MRLSLDEGRSRNVLTLGVSVTMLPTRSHPRQCAVRGGAEVAAHTAGCVAGEAGGGIPPGGEAGACNFSADGAAGMAGEDSVAGGGANVGDFSAGGMPGEPGVGAAEGGGFSPVGGDTGAERPGAPASGGDAPGGGGFVSGSRRPKRAAARRILKKYMKTIANANTMSSPIVKR